MIGRRDRVEHVEASQDRPGNQPKPRRTLRDLGASAIVGLAYYVLTSVVVALGVALGVGYIPESFNNAHKFGESSGAYANWDGQWYKNIAADGYFLLNNEPSSLAFFPAFPLAGRTVAWALRIPADLALVIVANVLLAATFITFAIYLRERNPQAPQEFHGYALVALGLLPTTFFFRMAYSESTFLACQVLTLYAMSRRWPLIAIAALIGLGTATRPVGVALLPAFLLQIRDRSATRLAFATRTATLIPLACWGLLAYMLYQGVAFGDPIAFARTQSNWADRHAPSFGAKLIALVTLEPFRSIYNPADLGYWRRYSGSLDFPFSLHAADPCIFMGAVILMMLGTAKQWLTRDEAITGACLLFIPYWTHAFEQHMTSMGRLTSAVIPVYLVLGQLAVRLPAPLVALIASLSGFFLGAEAALFSRWYRII